MDERSASKDEGGIEINRLAPDVLLVEDSPGDVRLTREAFHDANRAVRLYVALDGVEAMAFLRQQPPYANAPRPDMILLDLNLRKKDGREVLAEIKADGVLRRIPTVILTTSSAKEDIAWNSGLHANWYLIKPMKFDELDDLARNSRDFWPTLAHLPQHQRSQ